MKTNILLIIAFLIVNVNPSIAEDLKVQNLQNGQWLKDWMLVGPIHLAKQENPSAKPGRIWKKR